MADGQQEEEKASGADETYWDKHGKSILVKVGVALFILWLLHPLIATVMLYASGEEVNLVNQGTLGDSYGGLNALFSGAAMIAAITAVLIQTFEFRAQREELCLSREQLRLQLKEMEEANQTNKKRFSLDRQIFANERRLFFLEKFRELNNENSRAAIQEMLWVSISKVGLVDGYLCRQLGEEQEESVLAKGASMQNLHDVSKAFRNAESFFNIFLELAFVEPTKDEIFYIQSTIAQLRWIFDPLIEATKNSQNMPQAPWLLAAQYIIEIIDGKTKPVSGDLGAE